MKTGGPAGYVHGHSEREAARLSDQACTLSDLLHQDTAYPPGSLVLEAGCGVGAQTRILSRTSSGASIISLDFSRSSLRSAMQASVAEGWKNVAFARGDILDLPFRQGAFDHVFICFVLEHLARPMEALTCLKDVLKPGGTLTVIEGDHGSAFFYPESSHAVRAIRCLETIQCAMGGNPRIGRSLYPLLVSSGFRDVHVSPRQVYVDGSRPGLAEGFTRQTFTAMVEGVREKVDKAGWMEREDFEQGIRDLSRTGQPDGTFCYTFFKAVGTR